MDAIIRRAAKNDFSTVFYLYSEGLYETKEMFPMIKDYDGILKHIEDFYVAVCKGEIVSQMATSFPFRIKYLSLEGKLIEKEDAFLHSMYTIKEHRRQGFASEILEKIESDAKENQDIQYLYLAPENPEISEGIEKKGYKRVGKECKVCDLSIDKCSIPMYRKKNE